MTTCATEKNIDENVCICNLILPVPDTDFRDFLEEVAKLAQFAPEIIESIDKDLDRHAQEKKSLRLADRKFLESQTGDLPGMDIAERKILAEELQLACGRPRMPGYAVYAFLMIRGFLGSLTSKPARRFLRESMSLYAFIQNRGLDLPAATTVQENVNLVSTATRELIFDRQIAMVLGEELDDFKSLVIDSTAVKANSAWPTDAKIITALLSRAARLGRKLHLFGLEDFSEGWVPRWLEQMDKLTFKICLAAGKAKSKGKLKKHYRQLLNCGRKVEGALTAQLASLEQSLSLKTHAPSRRVLLDELLQQLKTDLSDAARVREYAGGRVFRDEKLSSTEKVLSLSDGSAAYIQKGCRNPVIGYKPQLVRSANGFVTSLTVPRGNTADCSELEPAISTSVRRTGVVPELVSTDDGYASTKGREAVLALGVTDVSISGSKGKKLTSPEAWCSVLYRDARRNRSAVESLMFTIKDGFEFGELSRRGLEAVRDELLEKVLAYNCCRIILLRQRRLERLRPAA
jgi:hypothetical protein